MVTRASERDDSEDGGRDVPELLGAVARDAGTLVGQHLDLLQGEIRQDGREVGLDAARDAHLEQNGARLVRTHDVAETVQALRVLVAIGPGP